jgi:hypothetical protein
MAVNASDAANQPVLTTAAAATTTTTAKTPTFDHITDEICKKLIAELSNQDQTGGQCKDRCKKLLSSETKNVYPLTAKSSELVAFLHGKKKNGVLWNSNYNLLRDNGEPVRGSNVNTLIEELANCKTCSKLSPAAEILLEQLLKAGVDRRFIPSLPKTGNKPLVSQLPFVDKKVSVSRKPIKDKFSVRLWKP